MCGIAGFIDFNKRSSPEILSSCTNILAHRGPDGSGEEFIPETECQVGLGHRRLSIIDLSEGAKQPMAYMHWTLIFNGEIFNYKEIRNELIEAGHSFDTQSDSEVILHSWEEWGVKLIDRFIGMYVFVIYDSKNKSLTIRETKLVELKIADRSDPCLMTCYLDYRKEGKTEILEGSFTSMNVNTKGDCGSGYVYLEKVEESDFTKEDFLLKK